MNTRTICAVYDNIDDLENAIEILVKHDVKKTDIAVLTRLTTEQERAVRKRDLPIINEVIKNRREPSSSIAIGTGIGLLTGLVTAAAALNVPMVSIVLGRSIAAAFSTTVAATTAGAIAGGVVSYLKNRGVSEGLANELDKQLHEGGFLISANVDRRIYNELAGIMDRHDTRPSIDYNDRVNSETFAGQI